MNSVSNKLYILVEALLYIAFNNTMQPLGGKKLASILDVSPRYLEPLLQALVRAQLLRSVRGPRGGYMLAVQAELLRMDDVLSAIEQDRPDKHMPEFSQANRQLVQPLFAHARNAYLEALGGITLDDLCRQATTQQLQDVFACSKKNDEPKLSYSI